MLPTASTHRLLPRHARMHPWPRPPRQASPAPPSLLQTPPSPWPSLWRRTRSRSARRRCSSLCWRWAPLPRCWPQPPPPGPTPMPLFLWRSQRPSQPAPWWVGAPAPAPHWPCLPSAAGRGIAVVRLQQHAERAWGARGARGAARAHSPCARSPARPAGLDPGADEARGQGDPGVAGGGGCG